MKIRIIMMGKTREAFIQEGFGIYRKRITKYINFEDLTIPVLKNTKNLSPLQVKSAEGKLILKHIKADEKTILLDENGKKYSSESFADFIQQQMNTGIKSLSFVIGGAYGFSKEVVQAANGKVSLSPMTFSHQIVRLVFMEQLYRAMTILNNEPYHNA